ncbi:hypothetical protein GCM10009789_53710 [Kribbella sancticallisti]|uniref:DUF3800 domain-containing protein n=1 Tax=Kribbella sancticallisti TaxID=460087 RepID=A0ABP4PW12_9ACTN
MQSRRLEVACDESGFSGTNLLDPNFEVITHASVHVDARTAAECVALIRSRYRYSATEYKSTQLLRQGPALEWLLRTLTGRGHVHLTDKSYFVVTRLVDLLIGDPSYAAGTSLAPELRSLALTLHRQGPEVFGQVKWNAFLTAFVAMMRTKRHRVINSPAVDAFFYHLDLLDSDRLDLSCLRDARPQVEKVLTELLGERSSVPPPLEPLLPALLETARHWSAGGRSVAIVHDEQSALTPHRVGRISALLADTTQGPPPLLGLTMVDSRTDPRVQLADLLAGAARHIAVTELHAEGSPVLTALLRPYLSPHSLWSDIPSWTRLTSA